MRFAARSGAGAPARVPPVRNQNGVSVDDRGEHGGLTVLHHHCRQGSGETQRAATELHNAYRPRAIIATGIAFGADETRQRLADVLVSTYICPYDRARVGASITLRGARPPASRRLVNALMRLNTRQENCDAKSTWPRR